MPSQYQVTEPHPTVASYAKTGRGGAGNIFKAPKTSNGTTAKGPASLFGDGLPASSSRFSAGRGGAGNIHESTERTIFSFDEELERQVTREQREKEGSVGHTGRGGAGNWIAEQPSSGGRRKDSTGSGDSSSVRRPNFFGRLSATFDRH